MVDELDQDSIGIVEMLFAMRYIEIIKIDERHPIQLELDIFLVKKIAVISSNFLPIS